MARQVNRLVAQRLRTRPHNWPDLDEQREVFNTYRCDVVPTEGAYYGLGIYLDPFRGYGLLKEERPHRPTPSLWAKPAAPAPPEPTPAPIPPAPPPRPTLRCARCGGALEQIEGIRDLFLVFGNRLAGYLACTECHALWNQYL